MFFFFFFGFCFFTIKSINTSILSNMEGENIYIPALILFDTYSCGFSTNLFIRPVSAS